MPLSVPPVVLIHHSYKWCLRSFTISFILVSLALSFFLFAQINENQPQNRMRDRVERAVGLLKVRNGTKLPLNPSSSTPRLSSKFLQVVKTFKAEKELFLSFLPNVCVSLVVFFRPFLFLSFFWGSPSEGKGQQKLTSFWRRVGNHYPFSWTINLPHTKPLHHHREKILLLLSEFLFKWLMLAMTIYSEEIVK